MSDRAAKFQSRDREEAGQVQDDSEEASCRAVKVSPRLNSDNQSSDCNNVRNTPSAWAYAPGLNRTCNPGTGLPSAVSTCAANAQSPPPWLTFKRNSLTPLFKWMFTRSCFAV